MQNLIDGFYTVKQARQVAGYSQQAIAKEMDIDVGTYRRIEENPDKASVENAKKFCAIVGLPLDRVFFIANST